MAAWARTFCLATKLAPVATTDIRHVVRGGDTGDCKAVSKGGIEPGFVNFWLRYAEARPRPEAGFGGAPYGITWNHLWYLAYLWCYTMLLFLMIPLIRR